MVRQHDPVDRRDDPRPIDHRAQPFRSRLCRRCPRRRAGDARRRLVHACVRVVAIALGLVDLLLRERARLDEVPRARELHLRQLQARLRGALLRPRLALVGERQLALREHLLQRRALLVGAQLEQHLPLLDLLPVLHREADDGAGHLRPYHDVRSRFCLEPSLGADGRRRRQDRRGGAGRGGDPGEGERRRGTDCGDDGDDS